MSTEGVGTTLFGSHSTPPFIFFVFSSGTLSVLALDVSWMLLFTFCVIGDDPASLLTFRVGFPIFGGSVSSLLAVGGSSASWCIFSFSSALVSVGNLWAAAYRWQIPIVGEARSRTISVGDACARTVPIGLACALTVAVGGYVRLG